jgi:hypothetical protein
MNIERHLSRSENKTVAGWMVLGNKPPWEELKAILNELGCYSDEIPRASAEIALVRWVKKNQLRMRQEIRRTTRGPATPPEAPAQPIPISRAVRRSKMRWTRPAAPQAFLDTFKKRGRGEAFDQEIRIGSAIARVGLADPKEPA